MKKLSVLVFFLAMSCATAQTAGVRGLASSGLETSYLTIPYGSESLDVRVGVQNPAGAPIGDVLYFHGLGDRLDNHGPLFDEWTKAGLRVIAFDLPSHGEDRGSYNDLNHFDFQALAELAARVEQSVRPADSRRPLILAGWSLGGLIAVRTMQERWSSGFSRPVSGVILFAPGVSVRKFPWTFGNRLGMITDATLTHNPNPPHMGPISPSTPFWSHLALEFAPRLMENSVLSQADTYPRGLPTLVFVAGDKEDTYAKAEVVRDWSQDQGSAFTTIQCPHARHELDNELPQYGADEVRSTAAVFAHDTASGASFSASGLAICAELKSSKN